MPPEAAPLLQAAGVDAGYGTMQVLWGVDLDVRAGETVLLLGANGAGKTTFLKSLVGLIEARHGSIRLGGEDVTRMRSSDRMRLGMTYMSELAVFPDLSIEENIRVGAQALGHADPGARVEELYGMFPALREKRREPASSLSGGQRKMLGIAKALGCRAAAFGDGRAFGRAVAAVRQGSDPNPERSARQGACALDRRAEYRFPRGGHAGIRAGRRPHPLFRHGCGNDRQRSAAARLFRAEVMRTIRIGSGAGYSGDRIEPAVELAEKGDIQYLVFECLGERTVALAQQARMKNPESGYDPLLEERMRAVLPICAAKGIKIVTNMGAANPVAAARKTAEIAKSLGLSSLKIAAVVGDDVLDACKDGDLPIMEFDGTIKQLGNRLLSANAYLGAEPMVQALTQGADIVITGRASDPALFLAPMIHAFGWAMDDWNLLGQGTVAGHLLECAGQITGGYFADPGYKDVPGSGAARLSHRRSRRGRQSRHHQGRGLRRRGDRADLQGAAALRGARSHGNISSPTWWRISRK